MRSYKLIILAILVMGFSTGCNIKTDSAENLAAKPDYDIEKQALDEGISKLLPANTSFTLPANSKEVGKINNVDLDNDDRDEIIAFKKVETLNEDSSNKVGFMVLSKDNDNYSYDDEELIDADSIEYAGFYDLNNDGSKEIIILTKSKEKANLHIYAYKDRTIKLLRSIVPDWLENYENFTDMRVAIGKMDKDNMLDIVMVNFNSKNNEAYVSVLNYNNDIINKGTTSFANVKNISEIYLNIGKVATNKRGVIVDIPMLKGGYYLTNILYIENSKLEKAFEDNDIIKPYYIPIQDIDNDKVLEIPTNEIAYKSKDEANVTWYKWSGKKGVKLFAVQIYYNYKFNYKILIPNNLSRKIIVEEEFSNTKNLNYSVFKFYYYDVKDSERKNVFNIIVENKGKSDDKQANANTITLKETEDYNYLLYINNKEETKKLALTEEAIKDYFSLIYE